MSKSLWFPTKSSTYFAFSYFFKNVGILIDCSFTELTGVLGVYNDGAVPAA